jgi:hypothetical protein
VLLPELVEAPAETVAGLGRTLLALCVGRCDGPSTGHKRQQRETKFHNALSHGTNPCRYEQMPAGLLAAPAPYSFTSYVELYL